MPAQKVTELSDPVGRQV